MACKICLKSQVVKKQGIVDEFFRRNITAELLPVLVPAVSAQWGPPRRLTPLRIARSSKSRFHVNTALFNLISFYIFTLLGGGCKQ